jgi:hypothetical protein
MAQDSQASGQLLWKRLIDAERKFIAARMALFSARSAVLSSEADVIGLLSHALKKPSERGAALRLLLMVDEPARRQVFPTLVELASVGHSDIHLVRDVIMSLDATWLAQQVPDEMEHVLERSATHEEYQRFAELLQVMGSPYLGVLVKKAAASDDPDIQDVAAGFRGYLST